MKHQLMINSCWLLMVINPLFMFITYRHPTGVSQPSDGSCCAGQAAARPPEFIRTLDDPGLADTILKYSSTYAVAHLDAFGYVKYWVKAKHMLERGHMSLPQ